MTIQPKRQGQSQPFLPLKSGSKFFIWGGTNGSALNSGGFYDPATNSWTSSTTVGAPSARHNNNGSSLEIIWSGSKIFIMGGNDGTSDLNSGAIYTP